MIFRVPEYYDRFRCIAGDCRDSCCIGWEIGIDADTLAYYQSVGGAFGERLRGSIADGCFRLDETERCPFLTGANLCDIYTHLGKAHLCQICTDHPRFFEWFGEVKEGGLGLCCEAAAALILSEPFRLVEREIAEPADAPADPEAFSYLLQARSVMLMQLLGDTPLCAVLPALLQYGSAVQAQLDNGMAAHPVWAAAEPAACDLRAVLTFLQTLEPMDPAWQPMLAALCSSLPELPPALPEDAAPLRRIGAYFLYRYVMKALFDGDILSRVRLSVLAIEVIGALWRFRRQQAGVCPFTEQADLAKAFSKEIEYSEENLEAVLNALWDEPFWRGGIT